MALLKYKEITKMQDKERKEKLKELQFELIKANVAANRTNAKTKEIKKAISRLHTDSKAKILPNLVKINKSPSGSPKKAGSASSKPQKEELKKKA